MSNLSRLVVAGGFLLAAAGLRAEAPAPAPAALVAPEPPKSQGLSFNVGDTTIKFYGSVRLDMHYDDSHPQNTQLIVCIKSEDRHAAAALPGVAEDPGSEDFTIHARLTRFGVDISSAPIAKLADAKVSGKIEIDFLANGGSEALTVSRAVPRLRLGYVKLGWDDLSFLAGQAWDIVGPLNPTANAEFAMWGAGNVGDRRPMVMGDYRPSLGGVTPILQAEVGLTGAVDGQNLDVGTATTATRDGESSGWPTYMARVALKADHPYLEKKSLEVGGWGHYAREHLDRQSLAGLTEENFESHSFGLDVSLPLLDIVEIRGELWKGIDLDDIRGGILQGVSTVGGGTSIMSRGYWVELAVKALDGYTVTLGTSRDNPVNSDVVAPVAVTNAPAGAVDNRTVYLCNRLNLGGGLLVGVDYTHWITQWKGGLNDGTDNRYTFFVQFSF